MSGVQTVAAHHIRIAGGDIEVPCSPEQSVLEAFERRGGASACTVRIGCRSGGCGVCRVRVLSGRTRAGRMSAAHVTQQEQADGYALACRIYPVSDLLIATAPRNPCAASARTADLTKK